MVTTGSNTPLMAWASTMAGIGRMPRLLNNVPVIKTPPQAQRKFRECADQSALLSLLNKLCAVTAAASGAVMDELKPAAKSPAPKSTIPSTPSLAWSAADKAS